MFEGDIHRGLAEGGILSGVDILVDPLSLFLVQATIIIGVTGALGLLGKVLKQPKVIFEIVGGIILGPSALCRNLHFQEKIFPPKSLVIIQVIANLGLVLYLFLVGLELDPSMLRTHARKAGGISFCGIALPFGLGMAIARTVFNVLQSTDPKYGHVSHVSFMVFMGTAMSITAFPVLARILKEGGLIYTKPGAMAMGAAALDDATAWCLLTLSIAIANSNDTGIGGYVFLSVTAFAFGLIVIIRPIFHKLVEWMESQNNSFYDGNLFTLTICLVFMCAWTTALLGVHAIFGAFIFGLVVPRESRLIHSCEKYIEQIVLTITMPLYFALSGLKTDITQIKNGEEWGMAIFVIVIAMLGKMVGCGGVSLLSGMGVRESAVIAVLMNTRGLVELIVLNVGLQAGILSTRTFSVMVIMCLFTTFITNPIIEVIYPKSIRQQDVKRANLLVEKEESDDADPSGIEVAESADNHNLKESTGFVNFFESSSTFKIGVIFSHLNYVQNVIEALTCFAPVGLKTGTFVTDQRNVAVTAMQFLEPTESVTDNFLGLDESGRLIKVVEESTDYNVLKPVAVVANVDDSFMFPSVLLPLATFCRAIGIAVNLFKVEGNPDEFPVELTRLADANELSCLLFNWRPKDLFFQKLFWSSVHSSSSLLLLYVPQRATTTTVLKANPVASSQRKRIQSVAIIFSNSATDKFMLRILELYVANGLKINIVLPSDWKSADKEMVFAVEAFLKAHEQNGFSDVVVKILDSVSHENYSGLITSLSETAFELLLVGYIPPTVVSSDTVASRKSRSQSITGKMLEMIELSANNMETAGMLETGSDPELGVLASLSREYPFCAEADIIVLHNSRNMAKRRRASYLTANESTV